MDLLFYDFETAFDNEYSLRKMSPAQYILDYRFEALGCGFKWAGHPGFWVDGPALPAFLSRVAWDNVYAVAHNALFDACIMSWRYNVKPRMWGDTIAMARNWWAYETNSTALARLASYLGLPPKMDTLDRTKGKSFAAIQADPVLHRELAIYGPDDTEKCSIFFNTMIAEGFPHGQLPIIDRQIRMATEPQFVVDQEVLAEYHNQILAEKAQLLATAGLDSPDGVMSDEKLALLLLAHGCIPPQKISLKTGKENWAFAKTDKAFTDLVEDPSPMVQALVAARLGHKTTIEETRTARFMAIGNLPWPEWTNPQSMPVPLKYSGAHTHRFSGDWQLNAQNLGRKSKIRDALKAPKGKSVVAVDASQIEARIAAGIGRELAIQQGVPYSDLIMQFHRGEDVYATFATSVFNKVIDKKAHPNERFVGKVGILSLQYGASWPVFQNMVRVQSTTGMLLSDAIAMQTVHTYRTVIPEMPHLWKLAGDLIPYMANAAEDEWFKFGPVWVGRQVIVLPNGNRLNYRNLRREKEEVNGVTKWNWWYDFGTRKKKLYGAKVVENIVQALAFLLIMEADQRIARACPGVGLAHQVHDELIFVVPTIDAPALVNLAKMEMARKPAWMPWLPLKAEGGLGDSYGTTIKS